MPPSPPPSSALPLVRATRERLRTRQLGRPMEGHAVLGSTNERALAWAAAGTAEGSTVVAEHQTAGRGRHGRRWAAQSGRNLTFSVVLRPAESMPWRLGPAHAAFPAHRLGLLALAAGLAVCEAVAGAVPAPVLKWPNDVLLNGQKCCGILLETTSAGTALGPVVLGVGLNVNQRTFRSVPAGRTPPTSLALAAGRPLERAPLLAQLLGRLEARYLSLFEDGGRAVRRACEERLAGLGEPATLRSATGAGHRLEGTVLGLAADGALRLQTAEGERTAHAGEVTTR